MNVDSTFARLITRIQDRYELHVTEIARELEISRQQLYRWANGLDRISKITLYGICFAFPTFGASMPDQVDELYENILDDIEYGGRLVCQKTRKSL